MPNLTKDKALACMGNGLVQDKTYIHGEAKTLFTR